MVPISAITPFGLFLVLATATSTVSLSTRISSAPASSSTTTRATHPRNSTSSPIVDLTYALHAAQITTSPDSRAYYNFSNIRYAAPPVRFQLPKDPIDNRSAGVQDGMYGKICPQAYTPWQNVALVKAPPGELESEDCLFLDVVVPKEVWTQRHKTSRPVIFWIHGGGFQLGSKGGGAPATNPLGLLDRSFEEDGKGVIWVGLNYRLGAFGWLQGSSFEAAGGVPNVGLRDQRRALDWVQEHIALFGGDRSRVTVMGESAGGGSIMHHITAYGGIKKAPPFHQAIIQSPAYAPRPYASQAEDSFAILLNSSGVSTFAELATLDTKDMQIANKLSQLSDFYGAFQFGIAPDGDYVPDLPEKLLASGRYHKNIKVIVAHNTFEAQKYTDPAATNSSSFDEYMALYFPSAPASALQALSTQLYPAVYNGTYPWTTPFTRLFYAISEFTFTCHAHMLGAALGTANNKHAYSYLFSVPPGTHILDVYFTYFVNSNAAVTNETIAEYMQGYFTAFASKGDPNRRGLPEFPSYGRESRDLNLNETFVDVVVDPAANERCGWWQAASYAA